MIEKAAKAGVSGVKMYPQGKLSPLAPSGKLGLTGPGVTTNSESGVSDLEAFYETFSAMEKHNMGTQASPPGRMDWMHAA